MQDTRVIREGADAQTRMVATTKQNLITFERSSTRFCCSSSLVGGARNIILASLAALPSAQRTKNQKDLLALDSLPQNAGARPRLCTNADAALMPSAIAGGMLAGWRERHARPPRKHQPSLP